MAQIILLPPDREPKACDDWAYAQKWLATCPEKHFEVHALEIDEPGARPHRWVARRHETIKSVKRLHNYADMRWHEDGVLYARRKDDRPADAFGFRKGQDIEQTVRNLTEGTDCFWRFTFGSNKRGWFGTVKAVEVVSTYYTFHPVI